MTLSNLKPLTLACVLGLAALASGAKAQSLSELYEAARGYDAAALAARAQAEAARFRSAQSDALSAPSVALSGSATHAQTDVPTRPGISGRGNSSNVAAQLAARYPLINGSNRATQAQSAKSLELAQADLESAEQDLIVRVSQAYFDVLAAQDALTTTRANKAAITEQLASARRNFEVGTATITDTREAQARFDLATAQEIAAENDLRTKRIALDQLVGRQNSAPRSLLAPVVLPATMPTQVDAWVSQAEGSHPTVRRARLALDVAQLEIDKARAAEKPTLDAVASVGAQHNSGRSVPVDGLSKSASIGVQFNWPLYTGGATGHRISETVALETKARNDLEAARRGVAQGTRVAFFGVQSGQAQVKALEAAEASSKLALEATQTGFRVGVRVNLDVLNAQTQLFQTQRDLARARYDVIVGGLRLRQASGQLSANDLTAVNQLLTK
jgi:outer membrane protein